MGKRIKILIVDDSAIVRERLVEELTASNAVEIVGMTGLTTEAKRLIEEHEPDFITLDLHLKDGSGIDLLREIKQSPSVKVTHSPRVVVLTNHSGELFREKCVKYGADSFLDKATEFEQVKNVLFKLANLL